MLRYSLYKIRYSYSNMCSYKNRVRPSSYKKYCVLLLYGLLQKLLQALRPKYAVTNSSCTYKLVTVCSYK